MKKFNNLYRAEEEQKAQKKVTVSLVLYAVLALLFVGLCTLFVLLYVLSNLSVVVCFLVNVGLTIAFCWLSVLFFTIWLARQKAEVKFFGNLHKASFGYDRGTFCGADSPEMKDKVLFVPLQFTCAQTNHTYFLKSTATVPFEANKVYDLQTVGDYVVAWLEAVSE